MKKETTAINREQEFDKNNISEDIKKNESHEESNNLYKKQNNEKEGPKENVGSNNQTEEGKIIKEKSENGNNIASKNDEKHLENEEVKKKMKILEPNDNGEVGKNTLSKEKESTINRTQKDKEVEIRNIKDINDNKEVKTKSNLVSNKVDNQVGIEKGDVIDTKIKNNQLKENINNCQEKINKKEEDIIHKEINNNKKSDTSNIQYSNLNKIKFLDQNSEHQEDTDSSDSSDSRDEDKYYQNNTTVCGIKNIGNNCYLNSGLQILVSCEELIELLEKDEFDDIGKIMTLFKKAMITLLNKKIYNPKKFIDCFCKLNSDFIKGSQCCSQNFIRTIIRNINRLCVNKKCELVLNNEQYLNTNNKEYEKFISNIFPESKVMSIFSIITKSHSYGACPKCREKIDNYSFSYFIDQNMYLDEFYNKCKFSDVLKANMGQNNILTMDCPKCHKEIDVNDETKYIKLPDILIFTLERYQGPTNRVSIEPNDTLNMKEYIDKSLKVDCTEYELFAVNIRFGSTANFGHEICQVKRNGKWYEINDSEGHEIFKLSNFDCSYGLFYRKRKNQSKENNCDIQSKFAIKENNSNSENWFYSIWAFLTSPLYFLFSKEKYNINYLNQGLYIISACDNLINELSLINIKNRNIITITKEAILKILEKDIYDESEFIKEFERTNINYQQDKEFNSKDFIKMLINNMNDELIKIKYNLYDKNNLKYKPTNDKETVEYNKFINKIFPQSLVLYTFSGIIETYKYGECKCGQFISEYSFEDFLDQKISLDNSISSDFSKILKEYFSIKNTKINCNKCFKKIKLKIKKNYIKLGDVLIFTLENYKRNLNINSIEIIDLKKYVDDSLKNEKTRYELFALNIKLGTKGYYNSQICKFKKNGNWYEIDDMNIGKRKNNENEIISGLFYKRINN